MGTKGLLAHQVLPAQFQIGCREPWRGSAATRRMAEAEYIKQASEAWEEAIRIAESKEGWKEEKNDKKTGDIVESRKNEKGKKIYRCKAVVSAPPALLIAAMRDTDKVTEWNKTLLQSKLLHKINDDFSITYQVTADGGGGMVSSRDFVYCAKTGFKGDVFVMGGRSVDYKDAPSSSKIVRAINGPGCQMILPVAGETNSSTFVWLMDCDYKGWMPQSVLDIAMPIAQTQFIDCLKKLAQRFKDEGKF